MHTPGPWRLVDGKSEVIAGDCYHVAFVKAWFPDHVEQQEANARLIAAAPEMLEALRSAMRIKDLWLPIGDVSDEHAEEAKALSQMAMMFESVINKATTTDADQTSARPKE